MLPRLPLPLFVCLLALLLPALCHPQTSPPDPPRPHPEVQALLEKSFQAQRDYKWQEALRLSEEALARARALQDKVGEARTLDSIGDVYHATSQPQKALEFYEQALRLYQQIG